MDARFINLSCYYDLGVWSKSFSNEEVGVKYTNFSKKIKFKEDIILETVLLEYWTFSQMIWVIIRNIYMKFEEDTLRNKEILSSRETFLIMYVLEL
jgi:hypothetical protein